MAMLAGTTALEPGSLAKDIYDEIDSSFGASGTPELDAQRKEFCAAIAQAVVNHITSNAQVAVNVISVGGVTTGVGTSGPGTGTGTIS